MGNYKVKITDAQVRGMKSLYNDGYTIKELASIYKITRSYATKILAGKFRKDA